MLPKGHDDLFRDMLRRGSDVLVACWNGQTTAMVQILSISEDGTKEYKLLGLRPKFFSLN